MQIANGNGFACHVDKIGHDERFTPPLGLAGVARSREDLVPRIGETTRKGFTIAHARITGISVGNALAQGGLSWEYVASNKDLARRVVVYLEDRRVLFFDDREDYEACRTSAQDIRNFLTLEIMNVKGGGNLEDIFRRMRSAATAFVTAAGQNSKSFKRDHTHFKACLSALRDAIGTELGWLEVDYKVTIPDTLRAIVPPPDPRPGVRR